MPQDNSALWLAEEWARQFTRTVESMTSDSALITLATHDPAPDPDLLWWEQPLSLSPDACIWVAASSRSWQEIGDRVLRSAGVDDAPPEDVRGTYLEIVNQSLAGVASAVSTRARKQISCLEGRTAPPPASSGNVSYSFEIALGQQGFPLQAIFSLSLANLAGGPAPPAQKPAGAAKAGSIDLLLDVELPVSVSFGRAQLMLRDVIKLTTGSIVELNRALAEPVEVIVNNCVIARGEVVVVEGNYGIRIKQVISRQERLRTLY